MKIALESPSAELLKSHGVLERELERARILVLNFQFGAAFTLPLPFLGPTIFIKRKWLRRDERGELEDSERIKMLCHELCHVRQILGWGGLVYLARHLFARLRTLSIYARSASEESECYCVQARVEEHYRRGGGTAGNQ